VDSLPRLPAHSGVIDVTRSPAEGLPPDATARPAYMLAALCWLKAHNPLYRDVEIDMSVGENGEGLNPPLVVAPVIADAESVSSLLQSDEHHEGFNYSFVVPPVDDDQFVEQQVRTYLNLPPLIRPAVNEFQPNQKILQKAYPDCFPFGVGGLDNLIPEDEEADEDIGGDNHAENVQDGQVSLQAYCAYLMRYADQRFARRIELIFYLCNRLQRYRVRSVVYGMQNTGSGDRFRELLTQLQCSSQVSECTIKT
jgi:hypothetical protein